jgi:hypothetical protein
MSETTNGGAHAAPSAQHRADAEALLQTASQDGRLAAAEAEQRREAVRSASSLGQLRALTADLGTPSRGPGTVNDDA